MAQQVISEQIGWQILFMKINLFKNLFGNNKQDEKPSLELDFSKEYPRVTLSEELKKQAYNLFFLVDKNNFNELSTLLLHQYSTFNVNLMRHPQDLSDNNGGIFKINLLDDFNGIVVHIISNDHDLIDKIQSLNLAPPLPSVSFPSLNPEEYGSLQGDVDFWFTWLWTPYWVSLTSEQQSQLPLNEEWREFIEVRII
ncbi:hypothetical protein VR7878_03213 [Vibrio ruber DSM 16370]|uniref:Uncharacterized protein n=1 Tax=Vibrio ruber (strain DSM 16370 / JCM 11486 / BCRC 17186 / CECT 7878 / LMG 23124 / VR1) TaxID=1123498 RepID=A0A1R4LRS3_VIBR1|nr:hypothetical protein VR7878_03213 [Vibrio ruber DSM 16370]